MNRPTYFEWHTHFDKDPTCHLTTDAPEWLRDACFDAHFGMMPDNWVFEECSAAYEAYDPSTYEDGPHDHADSRVDVYTKALAQWYADQCCGGLYAEAEERASEFYDAGADINARLAACQYAAICLITETVWEAMNEHMVEEGDDDGDEG